MRQTMVEDGSDILVRLDTDSDSDSCTPALWEPPADGAPELSGPGGFCIASSLMAAPGTALMGGCPERRPDLVREHLSKDEAPEHTSWQASVA